MNGRKTVEDESKVPTENRKRIFLEISIYDTRLKYNVQIF